MPTRLQQLMALSDEELEALLQPILARQQQAPQVTSDSSFLDFLTEPEVEPTGQEDFGTGLGNAVRNVPFSLAERGREFEQVVTDPPGTVKALLKLLGGTLDVGAEAFGAAPTENSQFARQAGQQLASDFTCEGLQRDPTAALSTVASVLAPGLKAGGAGRLGQGASMAADVPSTILSQLANLSKPLGQSVARGANRAVGTVGDLTAEVLGRTTGSRAPAIKEAFAAGREGVAQSDAFKQAVRDQTTKKAIGRETLDTLREEETRLGKAKGDFVDSNAETPIEISTLYDDALRELESLGITPSTSGDKLIFPRKIDSKAATTVQEAMDILAELGGQSTTTLSILDDAKQAVGNLFRKAGKGDRRLKKALAGINEKMRDRLNTVDGYEAVNSEFAKLQDFLADTVGDDLNIDIRAGARGRGKSKQAGERIVRSLDEGREDELAALGAIEQRTGQNLRAQAAGQRLSTTAPVGLLGQIGVGSIVGGGLTAGLLSTPAAIAAMPLVALFSPRAVGRIAVHFGNNTRRTKAFIEQVRKVADRLPANALQQGITVGEVVERATQQEK